MHCSPVIYPQGIRDRWLVLGVFLLLAIDLVILVTYTVVEGLEDNLKPTLVVHAGNPSSVEGVSLCITICTVILEILYFNFY